MKSEITNIRIVCKTGAFGDRDQYGVWIYGRRPDGKTVACKNEKAPDGSIRIWSYAISDKPGSSSDELCETEFTAEEWDKIWHTRFEEQQAVSNQILRSR